MRRGAEEEFREFVEASGPDLTRLARLLVPRAHDADDLVQTALLRVWKAWDRVVAAADRMSYVRKILVNTAISQGRTRTASIALHSSPDAGSDDAQVVADHMFLVGALRTLAPRQRCAVVLRYYGDLDDAAIAEMLGCSASTVRSQIHRALAHLRVAERNPEPVRGPRLEESR